MNGRTILASVPAILLLACLSMAVAAEQLAAAEKPVVVLDTTGFWRSHVTLKPPVLEFDDGLRPLEFNLRWLDQPTSAPPDGWTAPDFDDGGWLRAVSLRACKSPYTARLCLRGRFEVTDPARVRGLALTVGYHGGVVVYVNGAEVARAHLPAGPIGPDAVAESYPLEAFVADDGKLFQRGTRRSEENTRRRGLAERLLDALPIPQEALRRGVNVVAIELVRSPYHKVFEEQKFASRRKTQEYFMTWNTCEIRRVQLTAAAPDGLVPNAVRPAGFQVWNSDLLMSDFDLDFGDPNEELRPIRITGTRNGTFSGKVVVGSDRPIRGLKATAGELRNGDATIPAAAVRIRYALPWADEWITVPYSPQVRPYPRSVDLLSALAEAPLDEFPVRTKEPDRYGPNTPNQPEPVPGAIVPVWATVRVPADAAPGRYRGRITISADGTQQVLVPVELTVADWTLPDTDDYRTWLELMQSPDTLAYHYELDLWSEEHWRMIEQAMEKIGETNSRVVHIPLLAQTNMGNEQSMVRWFRKDDGIYDYDFTVMDRYLDTAVKHMGRPKMVIFWVWEIYLIKDERPRSDHLWLAEAIEARKEFRGRGPLVSVLDRATGEVSTKHLAPYESEISDSLWRPLLTKIAERLEARGLRDTLMFGMLNDLRPTKAELEFFNRILPGTPWALHSHGGVRAGTLLHGVAPVPYQASVWGVAFSSEESLHGWHRPDLKAYYDRDRHVNPKVPTVWYYMVEKSITGDQRGIGRMGADFWPIARDGRGRLNGYVWGRYLHASWRNLDLHSYTLAPGPNGPVASTRFEYLRESFEHGEALVVIEDALLDEQKRARLGDELTARCQSVLDRRQTAMARSKAYLQFDNPQNRPIRSWRQGSAMAGHVWCVGSDWQARDHELFTTAGEVERRLRGQ